MSMAIGGLDDQTFGAAVVSETLDIMNNNGGGSSPLPVDKSSAEGALVSKTLDFMNSGSLSGDSTGMARSYDFQTDVLGAYATGSLINQMV